MTASQRISKYAEQLGNATDECPIGDRLCEDDIEPSNEGCTRCWSDALRKLCHDAHLEMKERENNP